MQISDKRNQIVLDGKTIREPVSIKDCEGVTIKNCDFQYDRSDTTLLTLSNCKKCIVSGNKFHDKSTLGLFLKIMGSKTDGNIIENNEFWNHTFNSDNGGEPVRIGNSSTSGCNFNTLFRKNSMHDLRADVETISVKSCGNIIEDNDFSNNESMIAVRHGGFNKIRNNRFKGKGGIRLLGAGNEVTDNFFKDNRDSKWIPIRVEYGNTERDPNFTSDNKPSGKEGSSHAMYARCIANKITGNKFENCSVTIKTDDRGRKLSPKDLIEQLNDIVKPGTVTTPSPVPEEEDIPEPPEPEEEPDVVVTPEPVETAPKPTAAQSLYDWWQSMFGQGPATSQPTPAPQPQSPTPAPTQPSPTTTPIPPPPTTTTQPVPSQGLETIGNKIDVLVNQERQKNGKTALQYDERLEGIAASHSKDMATRNFFAHVTPEGYDVGKRYSQAGYSGCRAWGENILWFETSRLSSMTYDEIAQKMFSQWMNSQPHKENLLRSIYTVEGIGVYIRGNRIYATQDFCGR
jgi:uncharacterized protein YkwD